ncbi:MAG: CinA family nicotinamide mononucleotide deamidase-related protein [Gammaproteobacteria bacterium]|nr:CinA family nicotinamide mononucleotide deamidase-related protein [Gammaproteobacteria bacterium]
MTAHKTPPKITACLVSTGEEVLRGEIFDSNNHFLATALGERGFAVQLMMTAGDRREDLAFVMRTALERADYLFISGGLGPTDDDLTTEVAAEVAGVGTFFHEPSWQAIVALFQKYHLEATANNRKQAMFPIGATVLPNLNGTAPGFSCSFARNGVRKTIVALPGPPRELQPMLLAHLDQVAPLQHSSEENLFIRFLGAGESHLSELLEPWSKRWGPVSFRQDFPEIEVKLYQPPADKAQALCAFAAEHMSDYLVDFSRESIIQLFARFMRERGLTLALAESCTGGLAAKVITDVPGASAYFVGAVVSYANAVKEELLGVRANDLATHGAVSESVARQMATGARARFKADLSLSFTGVAGPDGGSDEKPVGTVWMAKADASGCQAQRLNLLQGRERVRQAAVSHGLRWLMEDWLAERRRQRLAMYRG